MLSDETPTLDRDRWERILDLLVERDLGLHLMMETRVDRHLARRGLDAALSRGRDSPHLRGGRAHGQATLDLFKKNTQVEMGKRRSGTHQLQRYDLRTSFVLGLPNDTAETIHATFDLAVHYDPDLAFFLTIAPWPYADMYEELKPYIVSEDYEDYNLVAPVVKPIDMTTDELMEHVIECYPQVLHGQAEQGVFDEPVQTRVLHDHDATADGELVPAPVHGWPRVDA